MQALQGLHGSARGIPFYVAVGSLGVVFVLGIGIVRGLIGGLSGRRGGKQWQGNYREKNDN
jgi:hypothetical protein